VRVFREGVPLTSRSFVSSALERALPLRGAQAPPGRCRCSRGSAPPQREMKGERAGKEGGGARVRARRRMNEKGRQLRGWQVARGLFSFSLASFLPSPAAQAQHRPTRHAAPSRSLARSLARSLLPSPPAHRLTTSARNLLATPTEREYLMPGEKLTA
jgi:hypothetical protein